jgi:hypothetical protein
VLVLVSVGATLLPENKILALPPQDHLLLSRKHLCFRGAEGFDFLPAGGGTHNPLVPGSNPGGPTIELVSSA